MGRKAKKTKEGGGASLLCESRSSSRLTTKQQRSPQVDPWLAREADRLTRYSLPRAPALTNGEARLDGSHLAAHRQKTTPSLTHLNACSRDARFPGQTTNSKVAKRRAASPVVTAFPLPDDPGRRRHRMRSSKPSKGWVVMLSQEPVFCYPGHLPQHQHAKTRRRCARIGQTA